MKTTNVTVSLKGLKMNADSEVCTTDAEVYHVVSYVSIFNVLDIESSAVLDQYHNEN